MQLSPSLTVMSISQNCLSKVSMQKHQVDLGFFGNNNSDPGSLTDCEERSESLIESVSIPSLFPANKSDTDGSSESNEISPIFTHYPNSIVSLFSPARSSSVSKNHYEIIFPNPSIPTNGPTSLSISLLFPPTMSETETYGSSSESNETQFSYSIMSFFPPARSQSDISENFTMISTNPSISASPIHTTETATFLEYLALQMLLEATNNFSEDHKIRTSSFGSVYCATLNDGREMAIKRAEISISKPYVSKHHSDNAFLNELKTLSLLNHKNLVCLLGFYEDSNERILVYDNMKNGTLHDHLHKLQSTPLMSWAARIKVALDAASGIEYLHNVVPPVIHRDIKSSNILLDATWTAKVSDFSLSVKAPMDIESYQWSDLVGTLGYIDPEYIWHQHLTTKSDVYSFGVILLEMLSGCKALHKDENDMWWHIVDFVVPYIAKNEIHRVLDPKLPPPTLFEMQAVAYVGFLAVDCVSKEGQNRPSMTKILKGLQGAFEVCVDPDGQPEECGSWIWYKKNPDFPLTDKKKFPFKMLLKATNNFSQDRKIETDSFGSVYRATLDDHRVVAVKRAEGSYMTWREEDYDNAFLNELEALSSLNHKNVVHLLGFCDDSNMRVVVYDYMENGTLCDHLHKLQSTLLMSWATRIKVALDAARGIEYLHVYAVPPIIHRDIKSSNILLDATLTAKLSNFSLSVKAPVDVNSHQWFDLRVVGTPGYIDPEYILHQQLTAKSDVYSFGVVLLEMLSGYKAIHKNENGLPWNVVDFLVPYIARDEIHRVLDPKVPSPTPLERMAVAHVGSLAMACVSLKGQDRPSMTDIVNSLQRAFNVCVGPDLEECLLWTPTNSKA